MPCIVLPGWKLIVTMWREDKCLQCHALSYHESMLHTVTGSKLVAATFLKTAKSSQQLFWPTSWQRQLFQLWGTSNVIYCLGPDKVCGQYHMDCKLCCEHVKEGSQTQEIDQLGGSFIMFCELAHEIRWSSSLRNWRSEFPVSSLGKAVCRLLSNEARWCCLCNLLTTCLLCCQHTGSKPFRLCTDRTFRPVFSHNQYKFILENPVSM